MNFPIAIIKEHDQIIAFANVVATKNKTELSVDLMRYSDQAPRAVMDYLFAQLMLWGSGQGYQTFSLGMAPLSGLESGSLSTNWNKLGTLMFKHGEYFYNFEGLRNYKEKFSPDWELRFITARKKLLLPKSFLDLAAIISGSVKSLVTKK